MTALGDNIEKLQGGGLQSLEVKLDKGGGLQYYKLMPATLEEYYLDRGMPEDDDTLDDSVYVAWYRNYFRIRFAQCDPATLDELRGTVVQAAFQTNGCLVKFTFMDGNYVEVTMKIRMTGGVGSKGPQDFRGVTIIGVGHSLTKVDWTP